MSYDADLIGVGAGPAGSSAAYHAACAGMEVLLLDRQSFPRDKVCGDGLLPHAVAEIRRMGLSDWLSRPGHGSFDGYSIHARTTTLEHLRPPTMYGHPGYVIPRAETDAALLARARRAGADFRPGVKAETLLRNASGEVEGIECRSEGDTLRFTAPLVVAADGVGRFAADGMKAPQNGVAIRQYFENAGGERRDHVHFWVTGDLIRHGAGYGWVFYLGGGRANVGAFVYTSALRRSPYTLEGIYNRFLEEPDVARRLSAATPDGAPRNWSLKMGMRGARRHAQGLLTAGDAGSMIYPLSGEGVGFALEAGRLAARHAHRARAARDYSARLLSGYEHELSAIRAGQQKAGLLVANLAGRIPEADLLERVIVACEKNDAARDTLSRVFYGEAPVYTLLSHPGVAGRASAGPLSSRGR